MFRVKCPICGGTLAIDERTRRVTDHVTQEDASRTAEERFGAVVDKVQKARSEQETRLQEAQERELHRKKHVEELFKKAQQKAKDEPDADKPRGPIWD